MSRTIVLYTKSNCPLCDEAERIILDCIRDHPVRFSRVDISEDPELWRTYAETIPVVAVDGEPVFFGKVSAFRLQQILLGRGLSARYRRFLRRFT